MSESNFEERIIKQLEKDIVQKYILLLLNSDNGEMISGKTKLMKELFTYHKIFQSLTKKPILSRIIMVPVAMSLWVI